MKVCVVGTGYVGLTTGVSLAFLGHDVVCVDLDENKVEMLRAGRSPIYEPHMEALLGEAAERLTFTTEYADAVPDADVVFIAVQTPSLPDGNPDLQYLRSAADSVGRHVGGDFTVVVNKSTVPIGSSNWVDSILREAFERSHGRRPDGEFSVASNPEFLREGVAISDSLYPDRIVVGSDNPRSLDVLNRLYRAVLNQTFTPPTFLPRPAELGAVPMVSTDLASAELIKYAANAFLATKISFINEVGRLAGKVGADITQVARGIGLDARIGPRFLEPGVGWGGSCFGKDTAALITTAEEYHHDMPIVAGRPRGQPPAAPGGRRPPPRRAAHPQGPQDRPARPGLQARHRRHARLTVHRHSPPADQPRRPRHPARPGGRRPLPPRTARPGAVAGRQRSTRSSTTATRWSW